MTERFGFAPLVGRSGEMRELHKLIVEDRVPALLVSGASGVGKTAIVDHFGALTGRTSFRDVWFHSLYRSSWTSALADLRRRLVGVPQNATLDEIEALVVAACQNAPTLIILDNVDSGNVNEVTTFVRRWCAQPHRSSLVLTAQPHIAQQIDHVLPTLSLSGIQSPSATLEILGDLAERFPERMLLDVAAMVDFIPQKLLFLNWIGPATAEELGERARNLQRGEDTVVVEDVIESAGLPSLFFLALGIHRSFLVTEDLLTALWDEFSSRSAWAYVKARDLLLQKKILTQVRESVFSIHELVHLQLEKSLLYRLGPERIPKFHNFFAEFYGRALHDEVTTTNLTHFMHHSLAAKSYSLAFRPVVDGRVAEALASGGAAVLVRQELERLDTAECLAQANLVDQASLLLRLGGLCNDLSDHHKTLEYMARAEAAVDSGDIELLRQIWYFRAVSFSNLGQSDRCVQEYFRIVDSCVSDGDDLACLSLGYLAHDLKYRDLSLALELGELSKNWAIDQRIERVVPKNMCNHAESLVVAGRLDEAFELFADAAGISEARGNIRELGRIQTNWGFGRALAQDPTALDLLEAGRRNSASVGDRRRQTQGIMYSGLAMALQGKRAEGRLLVRQSAELLQTLGDGRYFIPAFCWALQLEGIAPRIYPLERATAERGEQAGFAESFAHAVAHPEFHVYYQFWWRHFADLLQL